MLMANLSAVVVGIVRLTYEINTLQVGLGHKSGFLLLGGVMSGTPSGVWPHQIASVCAAA